MIGRAENLITFMEGNKKRFLIPVYQRNYDWRQENCKQLFDDLVKIIQKDRKSHFFGSIVSIREKDTFNDLQIIDGQQRLTTISLLFLAMYNLMKSGEVVPKQESLPEEIYETYLINKFQKDESKIRLKPVKENQEAYAKLFKEEDTFIPNSNLTINYKFFCTQIRKERISIDELYTAISRLEIINILVEEEDNPQLIFESLNSTGLALSEGDKIRNFILMGLPTKQQNLYYEDYWNPIEINTGYNVSGFVRDYLSIKQNAIPAMNKVYMKFKSYVEETDIETEDLLKDLKAYSKRYSILLKGNTKNDGLNACIERLNRLETTVTRPFFLEVLRLSEEDGPLSLKQVHAIFRYTENYLFRRNICGYPTNALNKIFLMLHREIVRYDGTTDNYVEKFKYALLSKKEGVKFPRDAEFTEAFSTKPIYQMNSKNKIYIFERIENGGTLEDKDVFHHCDKNKYTIEHIMPQHLTPTWQKELGENYAQIHEVWLHRLANLTLTAYNAQYSNNSFEQKKNRENGFAESGLRMNTWIGQQDHWSEQELIARNKRLMEQALDIWPLPETDFSPREKQLDFCTLADDIDLSGRTILRYEYKNTVQPVTSWIAMLEQVVKMFYEMDQSILSQIAYVNNDENDLGTYITSNPDKLMNPLLIEDNIYIERRTNTNKKIEVLQKLFKVYDENAEELVLYLSDENKEECTKNVNTREARRQKYWKFALPIIQEAHGNEGAFSKVTTSKENWLSGTFGVSGFNISCVANKDEARIDLVLLKSDAQKNKAAFDYLYARKEQIEQALGTAIEWNRNEDKKIAYALYRNTGIGINNENDWLQMAKFHAEWSKKFYDAFVPLLQEWKEIEGRK